MSDHVRAYSDIFIKYLFGSPENNDLLLSFLNSVQEYHGFNRLVSATVLNPFNIQEAQGEKLSILDVKAQDEAGRYYNIEVQANPDVSYPARSLYYWAKLYTSQLNEGEPYRQLQAAISINILNFVLFPQSKTAENCFLLTHKDNPEYVLTDHIVMHYIELPKISERDFNTPLERWAALLKNEGEEDFDMTILINENTENEIRKAHERYKYFSQDAQKRMAYEDRMKALRDYNSAFLTAKLEGERSKALDAARKLKALGVAKTTIEASTGLSIAEIDAL